MPGDPRSKLDLIYQEVLGEVVQLVERLETVSAQLEHVALQESGKLRSDLETAIGEATAALRALEGERRRTLLHRSLWAFAAAVLGGLVAGLLLLLLK